MDRDAKTQEKAGRSPRDREGRESTGSTGRRSIQVFGRNIPLPASRAGRVALGSALTVGGILGFLPILGFWMIPVGLLVLSVDFAGVRRVRRRLAIKWGRWRRARRRSLSG